jgi:hypothetical protein
MGYVHNTCKIYPSLAGGVVVAKGTSPWTFGAPVTIIPANTIQTFFLLTGIIIESLSSSGIWEIIILTDEIEAFRTKVSTMNTGGTYSGLSEIPIQMSDLFSPSAAITAKVASNNAGNGSITMSLAYTTH